MFLEMICEVIESDISILVEGCLNLQPKRDFDDEDWEKHFDANPIDLALGEDTSDSKLGAAQREINDLRDEVDRLRLERDNLMQKIIEFENVSSEMTTLKNHFQRVSSEKDIEVILAESRLISEQSSNEALTKEMGNVKEAFNEKILKLKAKKKKIREEREAEIEILRNRIEQIYDVYVRVLKPRMSLEPPMPNVSLFAPILAKSMKTRGDIGKGEEEDEDEGKEFL
jgi:hypothetical protein